MDSAPQVAAPPAPSTKWDHVPVNSTVGEPVNVADSPALDVSQGENGILKGSGSPPAKRRREEKEKERMRVSRACDRCKKKKTRCTGRCPCTLCQKASLQCEFTASYTRGRLPSVIVDKAAMTSNPRPRVSMPATVSTTSASPKDTATPSFQIHRPPPAASPPTIYPPSTDDVFSRPSHLTVPSSENNPSTSGRTSPEPLQTDQQGHYVGPASGVSFLLRIQKRLHQTSSVSHNPSSSIFTFGDAPLPEHDPTFFVLPPKADAQRLVERYFDFAAPTHRFLHRPTIEALLEEFYETQGEMRSGAGKGGREEAPAKRALLLIVFAQAQAYMPSESAEDDHSARYYFASEHQLSKERGAVRLVSVQARLGQCFYLLTQSRINHCWSLFGTMAHLAFAIGLNRGRRCDPSATVDYVELESRRRLFWVAYTLDKYLAAALGRPRTFKDEDIDQELPTIVNDNHLHQHTLTPASTKSYEIPVMMAPVEHIKLSRILSLVLRDLYPIRPPSLPLRLELSSKYTSDLHTWRAHLTRFLDASDLPSSLLIPIYQRQRNVLNLAYYHALLLVHRPFLLSNFASLTRFDANSAGVGAGGSGGTGLEGGKVDTNQNVQVCLDAAMGIVRVIDEMNGGQIFRAFWFTQYYAFCAVVVLYIYRIQQGIFEPGKCEGYFAAGQRCQAVLEGISETDCLSKRYCLVLEELRLEAVRYRGRRDESGIAATDVAASPAASTLGAPNLTVPPASSSTPQPDVSPGFAGTPCYPNSLPTPESVVFNTNFLPTSSIMADLTSWGQFDSLVTAGIGMLDGGFQGDRGLGFGFGG